MISNKISDAELSILENDARSALNANKNSKKPAYVLISPENIIIMAEEIRELRKLADPQALTAAFMAGEKKGREKK